MQSTPHPMRSVRFGVFEVDFETGELRKSGLKVALQDQPFHVLALLLENAGKLVSRDELQQKIWSADTFVEFDRGLNTAINKVRDALGDSAGNPRFIETLPRRGYRFLAPVETMGTRELEEAGSSQLAILPPDRPSNVEDTVATVAVPRRQVLPWAVAGLLAVIALFGYWKPWRAPVIVADRPFSQFDLDLGPDEFRQPAISPDGRRIVFVSKGALAIRRLDQTKTIRLAGTEGAFFPFFSPNGEWVGFFANRKLQKVA